MAFTILNEASVFNVNQAEPDRVDIDILAAGYVGTGVISAISGECAVTAQGVPDMTVAVAGGTIAVLSVRQAVTAANVTITAADVTNPRIDLIVSNNVGTLSATAGTPAAEPVCPTIPASSVVLAMVYVPANDTTIATNQITDKRIIFAYATIIGTETLTNKTLTSPVVNTQLTGTAVGTGASQVAIGNHTTPAMTATVAGHVPTPPNNTTTFLRGDGTFAAAGSGAVTRVGGNTTEATTTSTTAVDLLSVAALSITAATLIETRNSFRKTTGSAATPGILSLKLNTTEMTNISAGTNSQEGVCGTFSATNAAEAGHAITNIGPTVTNYTFGGVHGLSQAFNSAGAAVYAPIIRASQAANRPTVTITDVVVTAISIAGPVTIGADELHVYTFAAS